MNTVAYRNSIVDISETVLSQAMSSISVPEIHYHVFLSSVCSRFPRLRFFGTLPLTLLHSEYISYCEI